MSACVRPCVSSCERKESLETPTRGRTEKTEEKKIMRRSEEEQEGKRGSQTNEVNALHLARHGDEREEMDVPASFFQRPAGLLTMGEQKGKSNHKSKGKEKRS
mmetsp:Transcript_22263/g.44150  ORF Transcript_22263/g.44150 Transcript_22263/m.44150 type:complete len:103 (-) Transcript_22263:287-595(-)